MGQNKKKFCKLSHFSLKNERKNVGAVSKLVPKKSSTTDLESVKETKS